ncbi:hypothetical protein AXG93_1069s1060 [Marchantia polymorpha subsp. ruderalis]|uniref:Uncharacterized protein n=1 Tax=Marchantia polymorpha subsp. ruderalis TaxID=1480154 RepID=A0A176WC56_MARPO|nr:hypothetical protein AXG93_1069s1060 [Marchantia polymorpha subsp. ruderalis]
MRGLGLAAALEASGASVCLSHARYDMTRAHAIAFAFAFAFAVAWAWHPVMSCPRSFSSGIGFALCLTHVEPAPDAGSSSSSSSKHILSWGYGLARSLEPQGQHPPTHRECEAVSLVQQQLVGFASRCPRYEEASERASERLLGGHGTHGASIQDGADCLVFAPFFRCGEARRGCRVNVQELAVKENMRETDSTKCGMTADGRRMEGRATGADGGEECGSSKARTGGGGGGIEYSHQ